MFEIDKEKFGRFITELRKEKEMTQRELADKLFLSDKAVSKWETGTHLPDITVLTPLAEILGVTVTELLQGERMEQETVTKENVEDLLRGALAMQEKEQASRLLKRKGQILLFMISVIWGFFELSMLMQIGVTLGELGGTITFMVIAAVFGAYFAFFAEERIPDFYDQNKVNFYAHGAFRINLPGVHFNNSNWPYIKKYVFRWSSIVLLLAPGVFWMLRPMKFGFTKTIIIVLLILGTLLVPIYWAAKKYE